MTCKAILTEYNIEKPCWLPINPEMPFSLCTRCGFFKIEESLNSGNEEFLRSVLLHPTLMRALTKPSHRDALLNALVSYQKSNESEFKKLYACFSQEPAFVEHLQTLVALHKEGDRCKFYSHYYRCKSSEWHTTDLPWNCWSCMSNLLRKKNISKIYPAFSRGLVTNKIQPHNLPSTLGPVIDICVSLELHKKSHSVRLLMHRLSTLHPKNPDYMKTLLLLFFQTPAMIDTVFSQTYLDYIPNTLKKDLPHNLLVKEVLKGVRKRNWVFKEDLTIKTWHPSRLFAWCFDLEELKDFD